MKKTVTIWRYSKPDVHPKTDLLPVWYNLSTLVQSKGEHSSSAADWKPDFKDILSRKQNKIFTTESAVLPHYNKK